MFPDPDYERFVNHMAQYCRCRTNVVCPGVLAGGPCDEMGGEDETDNWDYDFEDEGR